MVARLAEEVMTLDTEIGDTDAMIEERFRRHRHAEIILSMPGFGVILGAEFLAATGGDIAAFRNTDRLAAVAGLARFWLLRAHQRQPQTPPPLQQTAAARLLPGISHRHPHRHRIAHLLRAQTRSKGNATPKPAGTRPPPPQRHVGDAARPQARHYNPPHRTPQRLDNFIENLFRDEGQHLGLTAVWHRLGLGDMPLEAKGCRHVAVAIPIVAVAGVVATRAGEQRTQPQHRAGVSGDRCQREVRSLCPAVGAVDLAAVDYLAEREPVVPVRDAEERTLATVDERDRHIAAALGSAAAGDVAVRGVVRLGWRRLHAADLEVHRTPVVRLAARAVGVDGQALPVGTPLADERPESRHVHSGECPYAFAETLGYSTPWNGCSPRSSVLMRSRKFALRRR